MANSATPGVPSVTHQGAFEATAVKDLQDTFCFGAPTNLSGSADALPMSGTVLLNTAGVDATTLATPVAANQPAGDNGKTVIVIDTTGNAHTITTAANKIAPSHHVLTFNGTVGSNVTLQAQNGLWYIEGTPSGVTAS